MNTHPAAGNLLVTPAGLRAWPKMQAERFAEARELTGAELGAGDLGALRDVRERTARALDRAQRVAPAVLEVAWDGGAGSRAEGR
ncbi:hypothetical protein ACFOY2_44340 [Nonomuraea purpurea]|uniref:Uncharacterized protein n=1 Tax=Nonomuraea purpurea TaxID=1849276 RepID=A0ABV8GMY9_9ACTN